MNQNQFLTAEWRKLIMVNYEVDANSLIKHLPAHTEIDYWNYKTFISLVGFMFLNTRLRGVKIPFHINFPEVNLRFYVRYKDKTEWKRGVVFIKEIVPKPAIAFIANHVFNERYESMQMQHLWNSDDDKIKVRYSWKKDMNWNSMDVMAGNTPVKILNGSHEEFITEHFWGYSRIDNSHTGEYHVHHPRWDIYPIQQYKIECRYDQVYGKEFAFLNDYVPFSVFLAEGSPVKVYSRSILKS